VGLPSSQSAFQTRHGPRVSTVFGRDRCPSEVSGALEGELARDGDTIVVCDLRGMSAPGTCLAQMLTQVSAYLDHWPGAAVVVCSEDGSVLTGVPDDAPERLLIRSDSAAGVYEMEHRLPPVRQARVRLPADPSAAREARRFTAHVLEDWQVPEAAGTATLVVSELVTNSIRHAQTVTELTLSVARDRLRIAVHDLADDSPRPVGSPDADAVDGRGLFLVEVMSRTWGVFPSTFSGKTVWAILDSVPAEAERQLS